ncbi:hypothetical protein VNO78_16605 [Psophocarpus tetragonolobus]|uniref:Uncharacterized protein n=1 Tax=Psophocarpus tetragonolobus TaxID=3891 RepID=A0AAN9SG25_PSOTE
MWKSVQANSAKRKNPFQGVAQHGSGCITSVRDLIEQTLRKMAKPSPNSSKFVRSSPVDSKLESREEQRKRNCSTIGVAASLASEWLHHQANVVQVGKVGSYF